MLLAAFTRNPIRKRPPGVGRSRNFLHRFLRMARKTEGGAVADPGGHGLPKQLKFFFTHFYMNVGNWTCSQTMLSSISNVCFKYAPKQTLSSLNFQKFSGGGSLSYIHRPSPRFKLGSAFGLAFTPSFLASSLNLDNDLDLGCALNFGLGNLFWPWKLNSWMCQWGEARIKQNAGELRAQPETRAGARRVPPWKIFEKQIPTLCNLVHT